MNFKKNSFYLLVVFAFVLSFSGSVKAQKSPKAYLYSINNISDASHYIGWSTVTAKQNGELIVAYSGGRQGHAGPHGRLEIMHSTDNGQT